MHQHQRHHENAILFSVVEPISVVSLSRLICRGLQRKVARGFIFVQPTLLYMQRAKPLHPKISKMRMARYFCSCCILAGDQWLPIDRNAGIVYFNWSSYHSNPWGNRSTKNHSTIHWEWGKQKACFSDLLIIHKLMSQLHRPVLVTQTNLKSTHWNTTESLNEFQTNVFWTQFI